MAYFSLLWKARTIERYRLNYEHEKLKSLMMSKAVMPKRSLYQKWQHYHYDTKKRFLKTCRRWCPEGSPLSNLFVYLKTDQTFPNFLIKSIVGFVGGIILTYLCFMFFVFQLSISLIHATIMSSIIGVLLTLGLAFSYRVRCLVFLLIPQFFSRVGRYTLTCYALVLILTGPATNTLKNSEVLSESMACSQEQIKTSVQQITDSMRKPFNLIRDTIKLMIERIKEVTSRIKKSFLKINRLVLSLTRVIESGSSWLSSIGNMCNEKLGTPYKHCTEALEDGVVDCRAKFGPQFAWLCNVDYVSQAVCWNLKPLKMICVVVEFVNDMITVSVKNRLEKFSDHIKSMLNVEIHTHRSFSFNSNSSHSASQVAAGIVTEIRNRADPILTWLSWSSCVTSLFLLLIIFRAKYYQHMFETRSRFDNRYITKEIRELDFKRQRQGRKTILPLNKREKTKYISTTSFRLVASEKVSLSRSMVLMTITTFKLLIHMAADYSLYWILMTIRYHGRFQSTLHPGEPDAGVKVLGSGPVAMILKSLINTLSIPIATPAPSPFPCLPNSYPPDFRRYTQIGVLIFLLWFFAMFEPYGLRLRHVVMGLYRPERARARAVWLYNHILRTRAGFMKHARRKLHREFKYSTEKQLTYNSWLESHVTCWLLRYLFGIGSKEPQCLLCSTKDNPEDPETELFRCESSDCPGVYCTRCFSDIGQLCTICLSPADYGDLSDVSLEKGSSEENDDSDLEHGSDPHYSKNLSLTSQGTSKLEGRNTTNLQHLTEAKRCQRSSILKNKYTKGNQEETDNTIINETLNIKQNDVKEETGLFKKATIIRQRKRIYERNKNVLHVENCNEFKKQKDSNNVNFCLIGLLYFSKEVDNEVELPQKNHNVCDVKQMEQQILEKTKKKNIYRICKSHIYYYKNFCKGKNKMENKLFLVAKVMKISNAPDYNLQFNKIKVKNKVKTQLIIVICFNSLTFTKKISKQYHRCICYNNNNKSCFETEFWNRTLRPQRNERNYKVTMWEKKKRNSGRYIRFWMLPEYPNKDVSTHISGKGLDINKNNHRIWSLSDTGFDDRFLTTTNDAKNIKYGSFYSKKKQKENINRKKIDNTKVNKVGETKFTTNYCYPIVKNISVNNDKKFRQYWNNLKKYISSQPIHVSKEKTIVHSNKRNYKRRKKVNISTVADDSLKSDRNRQAKIFTLSAFLEQRSWFNIRTSRPFAEEFANGFKSKTNVRGVRRNNKEVQEKKESSNSEECADLKDQHNINTEGYNNIEEKNYEYQKCSVNGSTISSGFCSSLNREYLGLSPLTIKVNNNIADVSHQDTNFDEIEVKSSALAYHDNKYLQNILIGNRDRKTDDIYKNLECREISTQTRLEDETKDPKEIYNTRSWFVKRWFSSLFGTVDSKEQFDIVTMMDEKCKEPEANHNQEYKPKIECKLETAEKEVTAYPVQRSCSCQCLIENQALSPKHINKYDVAVGTINVSCTCATQCMVEKKDVGTIHYACLKKVRNAAVQCTLLCYAGEIEMRSIPPLTPIKRSEKKCKELAYNKCQNLGVQIFEQLLKSSSTTDTKTETTELSLVNEIKVLHEASSSTKDWWSPISEKKIQKSKRQFSIKRNGYSSDRLLDEKSLRDSFEEKCNNRKKTTINLSSCFFLKKSPMALVDNSTESDKSTPRLCLRRK